VVGSNVNIPWTLQRGSIIECQFILRGQLQGILISTQSKHIHVASCIVGNKPPNTAERSESFLLFCAYLLHLYFVQPGSEPTRDGVPAGTHPDDLPGADAPRDDDAVQAGGTRVDPQTGQGGLLQNV
jgi:hypothetical protein